MGGISVGGGHGGKKNLDSEIPLVPFIDLLLCCVMFAGSFEIIRQRSYGECRIHALTHTYVYS